MTQNEQILEYIDGMLEPDAEQALFDAMARQPELRSALRQFIVIGDAVRVDREAYTPPAHVEQALMAGLGLATLAPAAGVTAGFMAKLAALGGRFGGLIVAFLLGALLAGGSIYMLTDSGETSSGETRGIASSDGDRVGNGTRGNGAPTTGVPQMGDGAANARGDRAGGNDVMNRSDGAGNMNSAGNGARNGNGAGAMDGTGTMNGAGALSDGRVSDGAQSPNNIRQSRSGQQTNSMNPMNRAGTERDGAGNFSSSSRNRNNGINNSAGTARNNGMDASRIAQSRNGSGNNSFGSNSFGNNNSDNGGSSNGGNLSATEPNRSIENSQSSRARAFNDTDPNASISDGSNGMLHPDITPVQLRSETRPDDVLRATPAEPAPQSLPENFPVPREIDFGEPESGGVLALEGRRNFGGPFNPNSARRSTPALDNWMIGGYYPIHEEISVGMEAGHESYDQTLYYSDNDTLQVDQRPSFLWAGLSGRYYMGQLPFAGAETFLQGTVAYSTGGPIMRLRLGGEIPLFAGLDFMAGLETSALIYTFQEQTSITGRWGLTTGVTWTLR